MNLRTLLSAFFFLFGVAGAHSAPELYKFDMSHSNLGLSYEHLGFSTTFGRFDRWDAELLIDMDQPENSSVSVNIDIGSLNTFWPARDQHLLSGDFFDAANFPTARFISQAIQQTGDRTLQIDGVLTLRDIEKPVTMEVEIKAMGAHPMSQKKALGLVAHAQIKRSDFDIARFVPNVSDAVHIRFDGEAIAE